MLAKVLTKNEINKVFDKQIKNDKKFITHEELFNLTFDFSMDDWRFIRTQKYWEIIDELPYDAKKEYTLKCVKHYINNCR